MIQFNTQNGQIQGYRIILCHFGNWLK